MFGRYISTQTAACAIVMAGVLNFTAPLPVEAFSPDFSCALSNGGIVSDNVTAFNENRFSTSVSEHPAYGLALLLVNSRTEEMVVARFDVEAYEVNTGFEMAQTGVELLQKIGAKPLLYSMNGVARRMNELPGFEASVQPMSGPILDCVKAIL